MKYFFMFIYITFILNYNLGKSLSFNVVEHDAKDSIISLRGIVIKRTSVTQYTSVFSKLSLYFTNFLRLICPYSNNMPKKDHNGDLQHSTIKKNENEQSGNNTAITSTYTTKDHGDANEDKNKGESKSEKDKKSPIENEEKDLEITKNATNVLNDLEKKILIKEHKIKQEGKNEKNKKGKKNKKKPRTTVRPMENPNLFQGDIILTNAQAKRLVNAEMKRARKKRIKVLRYKSKLRFMRE